MKKRFAPPLQLAAFLFCMCASCIAYAQSNYSKSVSNNLSTFQFEIKGINSNREAAYIDSVLMQKAGIVKVKITEDRKACFVTTVTGVRYRDLMNILQYYGVQAEDNYIQTIGRD